MTIKFIYADEWNILIFIPLIVRAFLSRIFFQLFFPHIIDIVLMQHINVSETNSRLKNVKMENNVWDFSQRKVYTKWNEVYGNEIRFKLQTFNQKIISRFFEHSG